MKQWIVLFVVTLVASSLVGAVPVHNDWLIVPGERVGKIAIGMEHAEILRLLGPPHREDDLAYLAGHGGNELEYTEGYQKKEFTDVLRDDWITLVPISGHGEGAFMADFVTVYFKAGRVAQIEVRGGRSKTRDGLSSANVGAEWQKHFPDYKETPHKFFHPSAGGWPGAKHIVIDEDAVDKGIAWRCGILGDLAPEADPRGELEMVAVHAPGEPMIVDPDCGSRFIWKSNPTRISGQH